MKLLLVDDDAEIRASVRLGFELQWRDVEIVEAAGGEEALRLVEEQRPDLVLLDVGLPDTDGYSILREIRAFSAVPVIMLSARRPTAGARSRSMRGPGRRGSAASGSR